MTESRPDSQWHLDKRVPVVLIFTFLMQTGTMVWWARGMHDEVAMLVKQGLQWATDISQLEGRMVAQESKNGRIENQLVNIDRTQQRILQKLDALLDK